MTTHLFRPSAAHPETAWLRTPPAAGARDVGVDRKREIIHGAVIAQQGNVTGHDFEFDADALSTLHKLMAANPRRSSFRSHGPRYPRQGRRSRLSVIPDRVRPGERDEFDSHAARHNFSNGP